MSESYLSIRDLVVEYSSGGEIVQAVNGVDLDLNKGETIGLVGETGAGKTTIAKAILRILPTPPAKITAIFIIRSSYLFIYFAKNFISF